MGLFGSEDGDTTVTFGGSVCVDLDDLSDDEVAEIRDTAEEALDDDLPEPSGWQMQRQINVAHELNFYVDRDGDVWIVDADNELISHGRHHLKPSQIREIAEEVDA